MIMNWDNLRLARLTLPAKLLVTLLLAVIGPGYLFGVGNIFFQHQMADGEPGLTIDDLRRNFHGLEKTITPESKVTVNSKMLEEVRPGGGMREYLEQGGEPAIRGLITWLENGAKEEEFVQTGLVEAGDPSAMEIIRANCVECHHADGGDMEDVPFAPDDASDPEYPLVLTTAEPEITVDESGPRIVQLAPINTRRLVHVTHAHILTIPVFTFIVGALFLMTGLGSTVKLVIGPLPMLAVLLDIGGWWAARVFEPFIYVIAGAGGLFGLFYAVQILCVLGSMWFGRAGGE
jgi:hypothetical protein